MTIDEVVVEDDARRIAAVGAEVGGLVGAVVDRGLVVGVVVAAAISIRRVAAAGVDGLVGGANRLHVMSHGSLLLGTFGLWPGVFAVPCATPVPLAREALAVVVTDDIAIAVEVAIDIDVLVAEGAVVEVPCIELAGVAHELVEATKEFVTAEGDELVVGVSVCIIIVLLVDIVGISFLAFVGSDVGLHVDLGDEAQRR